MAWRTAYSDNPYTPARILYGWTPHRSARSASVPEGSWSPGVTKPAKQFETVITNLRHRITNASGESINAKIQRVKYTARGFRNKQNFVHPIYFHSGGLDLATEATK